MKIKVQIEIEVQELPPFYQASKVRAHGHMVASAAYALGNVVAGEEKSGQIKDDEGNVVGSWVIDGELRTAETQPAPPSSNAP